MAANENLKADNLSVVPDRTAPNTEADSSYREILGDLAWRRLHPEIRARFSERPARGQLMRYVGVMHIVSALIVMAMGFSTRMTRVLTRIQANLM